MKISGFFVVIILSFLTVNVQAQLFWRVSGNGLEKPSYLFGTHHLIEKDKIADFDKITAFIPQTDVVVGEMNMNHKLSMQFKLLKACMMKDSTIHDLITPAEYVLVDSCLKEVVGKGLNKLGRLKPIMLSTMYELMLYMKHNNIKHEPEAVDIVIQNYCKKAKKKIIGLETIDQQINMLFNSSSLKHQAEGLVELTKDKEKLLKSIDELNQAYLKGDLNALMKLSDEEQLMDENEIKIIITDRNINWVGQLTQLMPEKSCFVAVGCLHLAGEKGLVTLLKNAGYTVEPVVL